MKKIMISAMQSGGGKTTLTCALLAALKAHGISAAAFKCGPDYIDPMFHTRVLGVESRNLDLFLQGESGVLKTLESSSCALAVIEGAMGFYDGVGGTERASAWETAKLTGAPVILAVMPRGSSLTLAAQIKGIAEFREGVNVAGVVLTNCSAMLHEHLRPIIERETGLRVFGYLPPMAEAEIPSRHLGLMTAGEIEDLSARFTAIAAQLERSVDLGALIACAAGDESAEETASSRETRCTIAVARDAAFCFYYADNLDALSRAGAKITYFSPLEDARLPACDGLYLGGGYPELYAKRLSENASMRDDISAAVRAGMPTVAECGGFLYLGQTLEDEEKTAWQMAGVLPGNGIKKDRLQRFGYETLTSQKDSLLFRAGEIIPAHEFHYWDSTDNGAALTAEKPLKGRTWQCGFAAESMYAAFPHLHFGGETPMAERFVSAAEDYGKKKNGRT